MGGMMVYKVTKNDEIIASYGRVEAFGAGALACRKFFGDRIDLILAAGQWDNVFWEPHEDA